MGDISVVIVSWNSCRFLRDCLDSLDKSGGSRVGEVIVVDNASTDGSPEMVAAQFPDVVLIRAQENMGFARANNLGLKHAKGGLLALINSDVLVHPGCFDRLASFLETDRAAGLVGPQVFGADGKLQRTCFRLPTLWTTFCRCFALDSAFGRWPLFSGREMRHWPQDTQAEVEVLTGCFWLARRQAVDAIGGLDERFFFYAEDVDWCKRFARAGWKVTYVPEATATHFGGGSSANAPLRYSVELIRSNLIYWKKHHGLLGQSAFYLLSIVHQGLRMGGWALRIVMGQNRGGEAVYKFQRSFVCLRWLVTGIGAR